MKTLTIPFGVAATVAATISAGAGLAAATLEVAGRSYNYAVNLSTE